MNQYLTENETETEYSAESLVKPNWWDRIRDKKWGQHCEFV